MEIKLTTGNSSFKRLMSTSKHPLKSITGSPKTGSALTLETGYNVLINPLTAQIYPIYCAVSA